MSCLKVLDVMCYICRGVLIEPVTVPCHHVFCYTCLEQSMEQASYSCPLCRRRISNWVRAARKTDKLINVELWKKIQEQFKEEVELKLRGEDDGLEDVLKAECTKPVSISKPGEVGQEFSKMVNEYQEERKKLEAKEELASKELIEKLTMEEELELESIRRNNRLKVKDDEEIARKLQEEINQEMPTSSHEPSVKEENDTKPLSQGPMDRYLKTNRALRKRNGFQLTDQEKTDNRSTSSDSTDSIQSEMHHFKPIKVVPRTPPKRYPDGKVLEICLTRVKPLKLLNSPGGVEPYEKNYAAVVDSNKIHSPFSAFIGKIAPCGGVDGSMESPGKRLRSSADEPDCGVLKEITLDENSDSNSMGPTDSDMKLVQNDLRKKKSSPMSKSNHILKKSVPNNYLLSSKLFHLDSVENNPENGRGSQFDTQDYLSPESDIEDKLIEEQRRIEQVILQEKADRELALKLSQEWEVRYELRKKPKKEHSVVKRKEKGRENKKLKQTLIGTLMSTRARSKR